MTSTPSAKLVTVAHILPWTGIGGTEIATLRIVEATRHSYRHIAFLLPGADELRAKFEAFGIPTHEYVRPTPSLRYAAAYWRDSAAVARVLRRERVDIVHFADVKAAEDISLAALQARAKLICHVRNTVPTLHWRVKLWLRPTDLFVFVSHHAQKTFGMSTAFAANRVLYDAIDAPDFPVEQTGDEMRKEFGIAPESAVIAMVARVNPQKDHLTLAQAAATVLKRHPKTVFLIIGDNELVEINRDWYTRVAARLRELGIENSFLFTGHRQDAQRIASSADFCVLVTHREGLPLVLLETMILGKATVATSVGGIPEVVLPEKTGYLHEHEDADGLARHILTLLDDPARSSALGAAAAEHVRTHHTREGFARGLDTIYRSVLEA